MHSLEIPENIQEDIRQYLASINENKKSQEEMKDFMDNISPSLQKSVTKYIFFNCMHLNQFFKGIMRFKNYIDLLNSMNFKVSKDDYLYDGIVKKFKTQPHSKNFFNQIVS